jgi:hypothetical protein
MRLEDVRTSLPDGAPERYERCDGPRPSANAILITLPGSRGTLTARSIYEPGIGVIRGFGIYCGHLFVTPLVKGSSESVVWR